METYSQITPESQSLYDELRLDGYSPLISKREYAQIIGCSLSTIDKYMAKGYGVPNYKKLGHQRNAKVLFSLRDVAEYLTGQTVKTV